MRLTATAASRSVRVRVPATTANLGPGFDSLGLALTLWNDVELRVEGLGRRAGRSARLSVEVRGEGEGELPRDKRNLVWRGAERAWRECGLSARSASLICVNRVPLSSGLGSSAAACVAGLVAANALAGGPMSRQRLLELAAETEGHPDNAAPALWGGLTACYDACGRPGVVRVSLRGRFRAVVCVPDMTLPTAQARAVLPRRVPHRDATLAVGRAAAVVAMMASGELAGLAEAMEDTLHQPYRAKLVPSLGEAIAAARRAGALGAALSGAGPSVLALAPPSPRAAAERIGRAMSRAFKSHGIDSVWHVLRVDSVGACVLPG
jgi:homoserine kinase